MHKFLAYILIILFGVILAIEIYMRLFGNYCEPWFDKKEKILKRKRNTEGAYKTKFSNTGYYRINNEGWNSYRDYYRRTKHGERYTKFDKMGQVSGDERQGQEKLRIAIVGHSNIEGLRVSVDKTLSKILEDDLNKKGISVEVYSFGHGGMHLIQAMHVSRYVVKYFQPDMLIIGTMLDDFWVHLENNKSFLNVTMDNKGMIQEKLPEKYVNEGNSLFSFFYFSKMIYYFDKRSGIGEKLYRILNMSYHSDSSPQRTLKISETDKIKAYRYIMNKFHEIAKIADGNEIPVFFLKFPQAIPSYNYDFKEFHSSENQIDNRKLIEIIKESQFELIDLEKAFMDDFALNSQEFDFKNDYHYNQQAHKVIGLKLSYFTQKYLQQHYYEN